MVFVLLPFSGHTWWRSYWYSRSSIRHSSGILVPLFSHSDLASSIEKAINLIDDFFRWMSLVWHAMMLQLNLRNAKQSWRYLYFRLPLIVPLTMHRIDLLLVSQLLAFKQFRYYPFFSYMCITVFWYVFLALWFLNFIYCPYTLHYRWSWQIWKSSYKVQGYWLGKLQCWKMLGRTSLRYHARV